MPFSKIKPSGGTLTVWLLAFWLLAGLPAGAESPFTVHSWSVEEGLPESAVISVIQSRSGYLWLGTLNGLARFDGNQFTIFRQNNTPGLMSDGIIYLYEDSHTNLWLGTVSGNILQIKDGQIHDFTDNSVEGMGSLECVGEYPDTEHPEQSVVWFYTDSKRYFCFQNGQMNYHPDFMPRQFLYRAEHLLFPGRDDTIWEIDKQHGNLLLEWRQEPGQPQALVKDFGPCPWGDTLVKGTCEDLAGNLIVATLGQGVFWFHADGKYDQITTNDLASPYLLSVCLDREGSLWVGTDGSGLERIKRKIFSTPSATHPWSLQSLSQDTNGGMWMTFNLDGASYVISNSINDYRVGIINSPRPVLVDHQQKVWVGTRREGLFTFDTNHFNPVPEANFLHPTINALFESHDHRLWVGAQNGLGYLDQGNWSWLTTIDGLSDSAIRAIAEDASGQLWIGTESGGIDILKDGRFTGIRQASGNLPSDNISCLYADPDGTIWVGTAGFGLARFKNGQWSHYSATNGLAGDTIGFIIADQSANGGALWVGSYDGLTRVQKKSFDAPSDQLECRIYGQADGLPTRECSVGAQPAAIMDFVGNLWFPTAKGPAYVNPLTLQRNNQPPIVVIESVRVDEVEQKTNRLSPTWQQSIIVPPGKEQIYIRFTSLNLGAPDRARFKYQMAGYENDWVEGNGRVANYPNLPPGNYHFHVKACNEDGIWNETGSTLDLIVLPPFWRKPWFVVGAIFSVVAIVIGSVYLTAAQRFRRRLRQQESLEKERSRIARDLHDQLGANLTQITLLGEMNISDKELPAEVEINSQQICQTARETTRALDEIVWAANPANDSLEGLANYACKYAQDYFALAGLRYRTDVPAQLPAIPLPPDVRHNAFLAFKEAVNNVVKHAQATEAQVHLRLTPETFVLSVADNGCGLGTRAAAAKTRNGLKNMRQRMDDIQGAFDITPGPNGGTIVELSVPLTHKTI